MPEASTITACRGSDCLEFDVETSQFSSDGWFAFYDLAQARSFAVELRVATGALRVGFGIKSPYVDEGEVFSVKVRQPSGTSGSIVLERSALVRYELSRDDRVCEDKVVAGGHVVLD